MTGRRWLIALSLGVAGALTAQPAPDRATMIADLLVRADRADAASGRQARVGLGKAVAALDRLGTHADAADPVADAALAGWRQKAGGPASPDRGRVLGPAFRRGWLQPGSALSVEQLFLAGQTASVAVAATPGQDVHLAVTGPDSATGCTGRSCRWTPLFTQRYAITVRNGGSAGVRYYLVID